MNEWEKKGEGLEATRLIGLQLVNKLILKIDSLSHNDIQLMSRGYGWIRTTYSAAAKKEMILKVKDSRPDQGWAQQALCFEGWMYTIVFIGAWKKITKEGNFLFLLYPVHTPSKGTSLTRYLPLDAVPLLVLIPFLSPLSTLWPSGSKEVFPLLQVSDNKLPQRVQPTTQFHLYHTLTYSVLPSISRPRKSSRHINHLYQSS